jgi:hypothetical protein
LKSSLAPPAVKALNLRLSREELQIDQLKSRLLHSGFESNFRQICAQEAAPTAPVCVFHRKMAKYALATLQFRRCAFATLPKLKMDDQNGVDRFGLVSSTVCFPNAN